MPLRTAELKFFQVIKDNPSSNIIIKCINRGYRHIISWVCRYYSKRLDLKSLRASIDHNDIDITKMVVYALRVNGIKIPSNYTMYAAPRSTNALILLHLAGTKVRSRSLEVSCQYDNINSVKYLLRMNVIPTTRCMEQAARVGNIEMVNYLRAYNCPWDVYTTRAAALDGNIEMMSYLRYTDDGCPWNGECIEVAIIAGNRDMVVWLMNHNCLCNSNLGEIALLHGQLDIFKYLDSIGYKWNIDACIVAASMSKSKEIKNYIDNHHRINQIPKTYSYAKYGSSHALRMLYECGESWASNNLTSMVSKRIILRSRPTERIEKCLKSNINEETFEAAVKGSHIDIITWLDKIGCPHIPHIVERAIAIGNWNVIEWLMNNGYLEIDDRCIEVAAENGHIYIMESLHDRGYSLKVSTFYAACKGTNHFVIIWLMGKDCPRGSRSCEIASEYGKLDILKLLFSKDVPYDIYECRYLARRNNHQHILEWLSI